jgi:transcriptional regulator with XRE-family HTH domain
MIDLSEVAKRIKRARIRSKLTWDEAAEKAGVSIGTLRRYEKADGRKDLETLVKICDAYGTSAKYVLSVQDNDTEYLLRIIRQLGPNGCMVILAVCKSMGWDE